MYDGAGWGYAHGERRAGCIEDGSIAAVNAVAGDGSIRIGYIKEPPAAVCRDCGGPRARAHRLTHRGKDASLLHHGERRHAPRGPALVVHHKSVFGRRRVGHRAACQPQAKRKRKKTLSLAVNFHFKFWTMKDNYTAMRKNCLEIHKDLSGGQGRNRSFEGY